MLRSASPGSPVAVLPLLLLLSLSSASGCPTTRPEPPPEPVEEPRKEPAACAKVFRDPKVRGGSACCAGPTANLLTAADVASACGAGAGAYLGETRDGAACRLHFQAGAGGDPRASAVMVSRPIIPPGTPAPVAPDPLLPWTWKKVALRDALGYQAAGSSDQPALLEQQTVLWAGRGRRIVGLHVGKRLCDAKQAQALLQTAIDRVP